MIDRPLQNTAIQVTSASLGSSPTIMSVLRTMPVGPSSRANTSQRAHSLSMDPSRASGGIQGLGLPVPIHQSRHDLDDEHDDDTLAPPDDDDDLVFGPLSLGDDSEYMT